MKIEDNAGCANHHTSRIDREYEHNNYIFWRYFMARKVFYSFHFDNDSWRASQVRNIGAVEGNKPVSSNDWEEVKKKGDDNIKKWINDQLNGRSCTVVLIGSETASRKWVKYELERSWDLGKGLIGIHIHKLLDSNSKPSDKGANPFKGYTINVDGKIIDFHTIVPCIDPDGRTSTEVYKTISDNLANWIEDAIKIRAKY